MKVTISLPKQTIDILNKYPEIWKEVEEICSSYQYEFDIPSIREKLNSDIDNFIKQHPIIRDAKMSEILSFKNEIPHYKKEKIRESRIYHRRKKLFFLLKKPIK